MSNSRFARRYPRPDGTVYCCGVGGSDYIPAAELRQGAFLSGCDPKEARVEAATATLHAMSDAYKGIAPKSSQACMRPCAPDALPIMGPVPGVAGAFLNYAHNCAFNQPSPDPKPHPEFDPNPHPHPNFGPGPDINPDPHQTRRR